MGIVDTEFEFALLGAEDDRLAVHAADHVEGLAGFAAQGQLQEVFLDAGFDGLAQRRLDLEEAVGRAEPFDALVRALVVVVTDPEFDPLLGRLEAVELGAGEEVLPDRRPEAFDLAQGHGMLGPALEVRDAVLLELGFEAAGAPPGGILTAVVGEQLLGRLELADGDAIHLDHRLGGGAAEQARPDDVARVIIQEGDEVGVTTAQPEGEDVRLPHLVGRGPLEETGPREVLLFARRLRRDQPGLVQALADGLGTGREEEHPAEQLRDAFDAEGQMLPLELEDLVGDGGGQPLGAGGGRGVGQTGLALLAVEADPAIQTTDPDADLLTDQRGREALFEVEADRLEALGLGKAARAARPPRTPLGGCPLVQL